VVGVHCLHCLSFAEHSVESTRVDTSYISTLNPFKQSHLAMIRLMISRTKIPTIEYRVLLGIILGDKYYMRIDVMNLDSASVNLFLILINYF